MMMKMAAVLGDDSLCCFQRGNNSLVWSSSYLVCQCSAARGRHGWGGAPALTSTSGFVPEGVTLVLDDFIGLRETIE